MKGQWYLWTLAGLLILSLIGNSFFLAKLRKQPEKIIVTQVDSLAMAQKEQHIQELQQRIYQLEDQDSMLIAKDLRLQEKIKVNEKQLVENIRRVRQLNADEAASELSKNLSESLRYRRRYDSELPEVPSGLDE